MAVQRKKAPAPKVYIIARANRPFQLRWIDPATGKRQRLSAGTYDRDEAEEQRRDLAAQLRLGIKPRSQARRRLPGDAMGWDEFRDKYRTATKMMKKGRDAESRLDVVSRVADPVHLSDLCDTARLRQIETLLLSGAESRFGAPRSRESVKSLMATLLAALNWAQQHGYLKQAPKFTMLKTAKKKVMKGRPITLEEFERMLAATPKVVGEAAAPSWEHLLRGLWESALRIDELMHMAWDIYGEIIPEWPRGKHPILTIPADKQKNNTAEMIPLLPEFEKVILEELPHRRTGWVFNPLPVFGGKGHTTGERPLAGWASKIISRIGEVAGVVVTPAKGRPPLPEAPDPKAKTHKAAWRRRTKRATRTENYTPPKFASAHDLRRSCLERLVEAGYPPWIVQLIARHASFETTRKYYAGGDVQSAAATLRGHQGHQYRGTIDQQQPARR